MSFTRENEDESRPADWWCEIEKALKARTTPNETGISDETISNNLSGPDVRTAKDLMRHSTIAMTADVYAVTMRGSLNDAVNRLPNFSEPLPEQLRATGTENGDPRLARKCTNRRAAVRGRAINARASANPQGVENLGIYAESERVTAQGRASLATTTTLPPRGFEPLSPA